jgi:hypothetical protein
MGDMSARFHSSGASGCRLWRRKGRGSSRTYVRGSEGGSAPAPARSLPQSLGLGPTSGRFGRWVARLFGWSPSRLDAFTGEMSENLGYFILARLSGGLSMYRAIRSIACPSSGSTRTLSSTENPLLWFELSRIRARSSLKSPSP